MNPYFSAIGRKSDRDKPNRFRIAVNIIKVQVAVCCSYPMEPVYIRTLISGNEDLARVCNLGSTGHGSACHGSAGVPAGRVIKNVARFIAPTIEAGFARVVYLHAGGDARAPRDRAPRPAFKR